MKELDPQFMVARVEFDFNRPLPRWMNAPIINNFPSVDEKAGPIIGIEEECVLTLLGDADFASPSSAEIDPQPGLAKGRQALRKIDLWIDPTNRRLLKV